MKRVFALLTALLSLGVALPSASAQQVVQETRFVDNVRFETPRWVTHQVIQQDNFIVGPVAPRRPTGDGGTLPFEEGEAVAGIRIDLSDGTFAESERGCYLNVAPTTGTVTTGVVNPWAAETTDKPVCNFQTTQETQLSPLPPAGPEPQLTGKNGTLRFPQGVPVTGYAMRFDNGKTVNLCYEQNARSAGTVQDGVIYPTLGQIANVPNCQ